MTSTDIRRHAPATQRNRIPILEMLREILPGAGTVLEIASGSGEHAVWFAEHLYELRFQPSDPDADNLASIEAWRMHANRSNVLLPLPIDATADPWTIPAAIAHDLVAVLCINMIHISPWTATLGLMRGAAHCLTARNQVLYLYGPFRRAGRHTAPSNAAFDAQLRAQNPAWGVRDLEAVVDVAEKAGWRLDRIVTMPANNLSVVFRRE